MYLAGVALNLASRPAKILLRLLVCKRVGPGPTWARIKLPNPKSATGPIMTRFNCVVRWKVMANMLHIE